MILFLGSRQNFSNQPTPFTNSTKIFSCLHINQWKFFNFFSFKARSLSQDWINKYIPRSLYFSFRLNPEFIVVIRHNFTVLCRCEIFTEIATPWKNRKLTVKVNFFSSRKVTVWGIFMRKRILDESFVLRYGLF